LHIFCAGGAAGMFYDLIEVFRSNLRHNKAAVYIEDILYWIAVIMLIFLFMLNENYGEIRPFAVIGFFAGMLVYNLVFSRVVTGVLNGFIKVVKFIIKLSLEIIMTPFRLVWLIIGKPVLKAGNVVLVYIKKLLHLGGVYAKIRKRDLHNQFRFINKRANKRTRKRGPCDGKGKHKI